jgi:hypothetical protein
MNLAGMANTEQDPVRSGLQSTHAQQAEALRRAHELRERGASDREIQQAMADAGRLQAEVNRLQRELRQRQLH